jgi:hypothetical protein
MNRKDDIYKGRRVLYPAPAVLPTRVLYLAFGSNLHIESFKRRCPSAKPIKPIMLDNFRLVFRWVADVQLAKGHMVSAGLWSITAQDEEHLDVLEGVPMGRYDKYDVPLGNGKSAFFYRMRDRGVHLPDQWYESIIRKGYRDFGLQTSFLDEALRYTAKNKNVTDHIRERRNRYQGTHRERLVRVSS